MHASGVRRRVAVGPPAVLPDDLHRALWAKEVVLAWVNLDAELSAAHAGDESRLIV
jgi:hypothetical protein